MKAILHLHNFQSSRFDSVILETYPFPEKSKRKELIPALVFDDSCNCSECFFMKRNTLEKLYLCMKYELPEITMDEELRLKALKPIEAMLDLSKSIK